MNLKAIVAGIACVLSQIAFAANEFGIDYSTKPLPEGVNRVAGWRNAMVELSAKSSEYVYNGYDASFVKVYFDYVDLPAGWALEVSSSDGSETYIYRADESRSSDRSVDTDIGQNGKTSFAAMSVQGGKARVRLIQESSASGEKGARTQPVVLISRVLEGYPEGLMQPLAAQGLLDGGKGGESNRSICGADNKKAVACYSGTKATRAQAVARLLLSGGGACTTWRLGSGNHFMTNNHCFSTASGVRAAEIQFNYQNTTCTGTTGATVTKVAGSSLLKTSSSLDYSLYTVASTANLSGFGSLSLDVRIPTAGETIYIPQHPGGRKKELGVESGSDTGGLCKIGTAQSGVDSLYLCDTEGGSSGSPVLATSSNKVINLHHLGGCGNAGVRISRIWPEISSFFNNVVP
jgi:hypothetical protein